MAPTEQIQQLMTWRGHDLVDSQGSKIGTIEEIYLDEDTAQPEWLAVRTGLFGTKLSFVPLRGATAQGNTLMCPWTKDQVKDAPRAEADGQLSQHEEAALYQHYGMTYSEQRSDSGLPDTSTAPQAQPSVFDRRDDTGRDTSGPNTDAAMTRSEEELRVGVTRQEAGRVRLRKWVETEQVSQTVPVQREEIRVEREPITGANRDAALNGPAISEEEHEVVLYEDKIDVDTVAVPKERIRLEKDSVTDHQEVTGEIRKERIEVEGGSSDAADPRPTS
ncbi:MAG: PRC and DUF2382 domain-containing protein [Acidimicrobiia bacterium]